MKVLDSFTSALGVIVILGVYKTPWSREFFSVETFNPNALFNSDEKFLTYDNAFDTFFDIVEQLR